MRSLPLDSLHVIGALDRDVTDSGIVFRRLPEWTRHQVADPALALLVTMPAGVRIEMVTDSSRIEIDVMVTRIQLVGNEPYVAVFDLVVDGRVASSVPVTDATTIVIEPRTGAVEFEPGGPATVAFDLEGAAAVPVEIWLPHAAVTEVRAVRVSDGAAVRPRPAKLRRWVHYGSSISHCLEATQPTGTWPAVAARLAGVDLQNLAFAGQCMLDQHVARTIRDLDVDFISIKAGINIVNGDTMRERTFVPAVHGFLDTIRDGHPAAPIVFVSPIICPPAETRPGPTLLGDDGRFYTPSRPAEIATGALSLERIRQLLADVVATRVKAGDLNLHLLDGLDLFGPSDVEDLPDALHPNAAGYRRMGERFHAFAFGLGGPFSFGH